MGRFVRRRKGVKFVFAPAVANKGAPTRPEITAGTDLTAQIADTSGFTARTEPSPVPDFSSDFDKKVPGIRSAEDPTITFWEDDASNVIRAALADNTFGYLIRFPYGDVATKRCEVWPVRSTGVNDDWDVGNKAAQFMVGFATEEAPTLGAVVPA